MTPADVEALAKLAYMAFREGQIPEMWPPFERLTSAQREAWRAVVRCVARALPSRA